MQKLKILNRRDIKKISDMTEKQWGCRLPQEYVYLLSDKERIYIVSRDFGSIDDSNIRIDKIGIYFGTLSENSFRLSIEGSQIIGSNAKKNIVEVNEKTAEMWLKGETIESDIKGPVIIRNGTDFLGCGTAKDGKVTNFVPKERRVNCS